jgi:septal ring factor EnvC (AmiA/AmiB activator)
MRTLPLKRAGLTLTCWVLGGVLLVATDVSAQNVDKTAAELRELRSEIAKVTARMAEDVAERDRLTKELRNTEKSTVAVRRELSRLRDERRQRERERANLAAERERRRLQLSAEREALAEQLRAAHRQGRDHALKIFLGQDDPGLAGRLFAYFGYVGRAQADQVADIERIMADIESLDQKLATEAERIEGLEREQAGELARLDTARQQRSEVIAKLEQESKARENRLKRLQTEQAALEKLLRELRRASRAFPSDSKSPFAQMRGKLVWPVTGKLIAGYGSTRAGSVKWQGALIAAERGTPVRSIYRGRVVYADWLAGMGLLVIVDHGGGFLSLYCHNEQVFRNVGDVVNAGDTLSAVGDTGGRSRPELYLEIRRGGKPVDPAPWFRSRTP